MKTGLRRYIKFSFPFLIAASGYLGYEAVLLRMEAAAFQSGHYDEAARLAGPVALMRRSLGDQLRAQLDEIDAQGPAAAQLPLLEKLHELAPDAEIAARLAKARLLGAPADALALQGALVRFEAALPPASPETEAPFRAQPVPGKATSWGALCRLAQRLPDGSWQEFGEGFAGALGASFALQDDGHTVLVAGDAGIERWDLATGQMALSETPEAPQFVAARPHSDDVAYTVATDEGDALYVIEKGQSRRLYPLEGQPALPWLGFAFAPDGRSLWVAWEESGAASEPATHLVWLSFAGEVLMEATLDVPLETLSPSWLASSDARRMVLMAAEGQVTRKGSGPSGPLGAWLWTWGQPAPTPLSEPGRLIGWSPDGSKLVALDGRTLSVFDADQPSRHTRRTYSELPAVFAPRAGGFSWLDDRLRLAGRAADRAEGPYRDVVITVGVSLSAASASHAAR